MQRKKVDPMEILDDIVKMVFYQTRGRHSSLGSAKGKKFEKSFDYEGEPLETARDIVRQGERQNPMDVPVEDIPPDAVPASSDEYVKNVQDNVIPDMNQAVPQATFGMDDNMMPLAGQSSEVSSDIAGMGPSNQPSGALNVMGVDLSKPNGPDLISSDPMDDISSLGLMNATDLGRVRLLKYVYSKLISLKNLLYNKLTNQRYDELRHMVDACCESFEDVINNFDLFRDKIDNFVKLVQKFIVSVCDEIDKLRKK